MNYDDFKDRFDTLDAFVDASDKKLYKSYIREHYISPIINLEEDYLGDGLFSFAYDMIQKYPERKTQILNAISSQDNGVWLHVNISNKLFPQNYDLERKIDFLKNEIIKQEVPANKFVEKQKNFSSNF
jgi:disulfide oxidoreductase YuzD